MFLVTVSFFAGRISSNNEFVNRSVPEKERNEQKSSDTVSPEGSLKRSLHLRYDFRGRQRSITAHQSAVAADHGRCSEMGLEIMRANGNAVDASITTALCQGIYNPMASGLGGGHISIIRTPNGSFDVIDARETAPFKASEDMFKGNESASVKGGLAVAIPLELQGLYLAHNRHGSMPWSEVVRPVIYIAEKGFPAHPYLIEALENADIGNIQDFKKLFYIQDHKAPGGWRPPLVNETCCQRPKLAALLKDVAQYGPSVLYDGKYSEMLSNEIQDAGGVITLNDLRDARAKIKSPIHAHVFGVDIWVPPPPSSAAAIIAALQIIDTYETPFAATGDLGVHREVEALKHAFALRMSFGDPGCDLEDCLKSDFVPHINEIINDAISLSFAEAMVSLSKDNTTLDLKCYGGKWNVVDGGFLHDDHGTSHMSIVDSDGMAVSLTSTINTGFGSKLISHSTEIILNNQMDDFSTASQSNIYGLPPSESNFIQPGKKPLSSMSPLIIEKNNNLALVAGASGGPRIVSALAQFLVKFLAEGLDIFSALVEPRLHHQLLPNKIFAENWDSYHYDNTTLSFLGLRGHDIGNTDWGAVIQAISLEIDAETGKYVYHVASDPRKDGAPAGD